MCRSRRLAPGAQIRSLLALDDHVRNLDEGGGSVYFTANIEDDAVHKQRPDRELIVKWGVTRGVPRRQLEYHDCEVGRTQIWFLAVHVKRRLLAGEFTSHIVCRIG